MISHAADLKIAAAADDTGAAEAYGREGQQATQEVNTMSGMNRLPRLVPLAGVVFGVLTMAGYSAIGPFPDTDATTSELTSFYAASHGGVATGGFLLGLAAIFLALFGTAVWARIQAAGLHPIVAGAALVGTAMSATVGIASAGAYSILGEIGGQPNLSPAALQAWHITGSAGILDGGGVILLLAFATAGIAGRAFPAWLAWPALGLAIGSLIPISPFGFYVSLVVLVWTAVTGIVMAVRPTTVASAREGSPTAAVQSGPALTS